MVPPREAVEVASAAEEVEGSPLDMVLLREAEEVVSAAEMVEKSPLDMVLPREVEKLASAAEEVAGSLLDTVLPREVGLVASAVEEVAVCRLAMALLAVAAGEVDTGAVRAAVTAAPMAATLSLGQTASLPLLRVRFPVVDRHHFPPERASTEGLSQLAASPNLES